MKNFKFFLKVITSVFIIILLSFSGCSTKHTVDDQETSRSSELNEKIKKWDIPDSPVGNAFNDMLYAMQKDDDGYSKKFFKEKYSEGLYSAYPVNEHLKVLKNVKMTLMNLELESFKELGPYNAELILKPVEVGQGIKANISLESQPPHRIAGLSLMPLYNNDNFSGIEGPGKANRNYNSLKSYITQLVEQKMKKDKVAGLSIALVNKDGIIWTINSGFADLENKIPVTSDTHFRIGSVSKVFTATAIMQLAEQGKIDIDQPIQTYIPEFSMKTRFPDSKPITIRSIMTHTSGLPFDYLPVFSPKYPYFADLVKDIKDEYVAYPPEFITAYSNLAVDLLGIVVERVSGQKFDDYMTDHIFKPLEMKYSSFQARDDMKPVMSRGYRKNRETEDMHLGISPAGSMHTSVNEMSHFIQMVLSEGIYNENRIIKEKTFAEMTTPQTNLALDLDKKGQYGLNWDLSATNPQWGKVFSHLGGTELFFSVLYILKEQDIGIVLLTNSINGVGAASQIVAETINKSLLINRRPVSVRIKNPNLIKNNLALTPVEGVYYTRSFGLVNFKKEKQNLSFDVSYSSFIKFKLILQKDQWYIVKNYLFGLIPLRVVPGLRVGAADIDGKKVMINSFDRATIWGEKLDILPIPPVWLKRCGKYEAVDKSLNMAQEAEIEIRHGVIIITVKSNIPANFWQFSAIPVSDSELRTNGFGQHMRETIRFVQIDGSERLVYSGAEFVKK